LHEELILCEKFLVEDFLDEDFPVLFGTNIIERGRLYPESIFFALLDPQFAILRQISIDFTLIGKLLLFDRRRIILLHQVNYLWRLVEIRPPLTLLLIVGNSITRSILEYDLFGFYWFNRNTNFVIIEHFLE